MSTFSPAGQVPVDEILSGFGTGDEVAPPREHRRRTGLVMVLALLLVLAGGFVGWRLLVPRSAAGPAAHVAAFDRTQQDNDRLDADDADQLQVDPASTRLLVSTSAAASYVARSVSGRLCLLQVPAGDVSVESCVPDRAGAVATIGTNGGGMLRLVADGGPAPKASDGWTSAGPNLWTHA